MRRLLVVLLMVVCLGWSAAQAIVELDDTKPANSGLISTFAGYERETRAKVNELITAFSTPNGNSTIEVFAEWYGAMGDNSTDDSAAVAAAIASIPNGGTLRLACKDYKFNVEISTPLVIQGCGGQWDIYNPPPGLYPYDVTKPVIKATSAAAHSPIVLKDLAVYGNNTSTLTGVQLGSGSYGSRIDGCTITGFIQDNLLIGDDSDLAMPITNVHITNTAIVSANRRGNAVRLQAGSTYAGNSWITGTSFSHGFISQNFTSALATWNDLTSYSAGAYVSAVDDHNPDNSTDDWGWIFVADSDCTSGATEPTWTTTEGGSTASDGTCTWTTHQRGRAVWLDGADIMISDTYIEPAHFAGIRQDSYGAWGCQVMGSNVRLEEGSATAVYFENRQDYGPYYYGIRGELWSSGYYKQKGSKAFNLGRTGYSTTMNVQYVPNLFYPRLWWGFDLLDASLGTDLTTVNKANWLIDTDGDLVQTSSGNTTITSTNGFLRLTSVNGIGLYDDVYVDENATFGDRVAINNTIDPKARLSILDGNMTQRTVYEQSAIRLEITTAPASSNSATIEPIISYLTISGSVNLGYFGGIQSIVTDSSTGTVSGVSDIPSTIILDSNGTLTSAKHFLFGSEVTGSGTITNNYGIYGSKPSITSGAITNNYGIYLEDQDVGGTKNYAIYTNDGDIQLGALAGSGTRYVTADADGKLATVATATTAGTASVPLTNVYLGDAATNNINLTGTAAAPVTVTLPGQTGTVTVAPTTTTAGKVLQGTTTAGLGAWSTPTYPSASGTARKILVSDGTNNVYSTELWPVPGAVNGVMVSDGTDWTRATTLSGLTFVAPVLGAASGTTLGLSTPRPTPGSGTGVTVDDAGSLRTQVYKVSVAKENFVTAAVNHDLTIATLPAKTVVHAVIADVTEAFACASTCTTATLAGTVGISAGGVEFLESFDMDAGIATFGDADAEVGTKLDVAGGTNSGYISWAGTAVVFRATSGTGNWGNTSATNLSAGAVTFYILYSILP